MYHPYECHPNPYMIAGATEDYIDWGSSSPLRRISPTVDDIYEQPNTAIDPNALHSLGDGDSTVSSWPRQSPALSAEDFRRSQSPMEQPSSISIVQGWPTLPPEQLEYQNALNSASASINSAYTYAALSQHPAIAPDTGQVTSHNIAHSSTSQPHQLEMNAFFRELDSSSEHSEQDGGQDVVQADHEGEQVIKRASCRTRKKTNYEGAEHRCDICKIGFSRKSNKDTHQRTKHEGKSKGSYRCLLCRNHKRIGRLTDLYRHFFNVHKQHKIKCECCPTEVAARSDCLEKHLVRDHQFDKDTAHVIATVRFKREKERASDEIKSMIEHHAISETPTASQTYIAQRGRPRRLPSQIAAQHSRNFAAMPVQHQPDFRPPCPVGQYFPGPPGYNFARPNRPARNSLPHC